MGLRISGPERVRLCIGIEGPANEVRLHGRRAPPASNFLSLPYDASLSFRKVSGTVVECLSVSA